MLLACGGGRALELGGEKLNLPVNFGLKIRAGRVWSALLPCPESRLPGWGVSRRPTGCCLPAQPAPGLPLKKGGWPCGLWPMMAQALWCQLHDGLLLPGGPGHRLSGCLRAEVRQTRGQLPSQSHRVWGEGTHKHGLHTLFYFPVKVSLKFVNRKGEKSGSNSLEILEGKSKR